MAGSECTRHRVCIDTMGPPILGRRVVLPMHSLMCGLWMRIHLVNSWEREGAPGRHSIKPAPSGFFSKERYGTCQGSGYLPNNEMFWGDTYLLPTFIFPSNLSVLFLIMCTSVLWAKGIVTKQMCGFRSVEKNFIYCITGEKGWSYKRRCGLEPGPRCCPSVQEHCSFQRPLVRHLQPLDLGSFQWKMQTQLYLTS